MITLGEALPPLERVFTAVDLVAYGAATWDWHRLHYDLDYARSMKLPGVVVDGQAFGAVLARAALDWAGPRAFITRLSFRMKSMAFAGDTLRAEGEVTAVRALTGGHLIVLAQRLTNTGRLAAEATTEIRLPD
ncbi:MAG: MaoC/PaaZ C-terminal domain-containing protein [Burkholderiales bacterium]